MPSPTATPKQQDPYSGVRAHTHTQTNSWPWIEGDRRHPQAEAELEVAYGRLIVRDVSRGEGGWRGGVVNVSLYYRGRTLPECRY